MKKLTTLLLILAAFSLFSPNIVISQEAPQSPTEIITATYFDTTPPLRDMELIEPGVRKRAWKDDVIKNHMGFKEELKNMPLPKGPDPVLQDKNGNKSSRSIGANFDGVSNLSGVAPPDTDGDVGPNHYMQMVNLAFAIYDKEGTLLYGPADNSTIWNGFVGSWTGTNDGDPIVLYDEQADRWMASQFAVNTDDGTQWMLVAISQSPDPTGSWHRYAFEFTNMPDYPKFGIWPDGYYLSVNQFEKSGSNYDWKGAGACALNRDKMIAGDASAEMVFFDLGTAYGSLLPADFDGTNLPPADAPNYFTSFTTGKLQMWELEVDWTNTDNSTITKKSDISVSSFSTSGFTIDQPGTTTTLDDLADRLMYRLQYRNFGGYEAMVTNHTVNNGSGQASVRWYELRKTASSWTLHQEGTYSPDSDHRWMASIAMNANGDIGLGYSVSSSSTYPSIRFTGRNNGDPLGQMTFTETTIFNGTSSQSGVSRWGDYSMMSIDPDNDLTFWFTTEYSSGSWDWRTRIASFDIAPIGPSLKYLSHTIDDSQGNNNGQIDAGETVNIEITVQNNGSELLNNVTGMLSESSAFVTVNTAQAQSYGNVSIQETSTATFNITAGANTPVGEVIQMLLNLNATGGHSFDDNFDITIGQPNIVVIDLDETKTSGPNMETSIENLGLSVDYTTSIPTNLSSYELAFVCLGIYGDNHVLTSTEGQTLATFVNNGGKLFMEGGDTWAYDSQTSVHSLFNIDGVADGSSDLATILGQNGTFTSGLNYSYTGENNWIDHIDPISTAFLIFANQSPSYGCAVAYDEGTYKTIGTSFEFGGMASRASQDDIMEKYLDFFEMFQQQGTPDISVNPQSFNQTMLTGETAAQNLTILNSGDATLDFNIQIDYLNPETGWLTVNPSSGNISPTLAQQVNVNFDAAGLSEGTYTANILVNSNDPDSPQLTIPVTLDIEASLVADFTANVTTIYEGESVDFTDLSTGGPDNWDWYFEGVTATTSTAQHPTGIIYNNAGIFDVALTVTNAFGSDTEIKTDYITVNVIPLPVANFEASETVIYEGGAIDFTDLSSNNPTSWQWTFDGAETASSNLQHPTGIFYNNAGIFDVALTVTNAFGSDTETKTDYITVNVIPLPVANFETNETVIYEGGLIDFTDLSTNNPTSWAWAFDGAVNTSSNLEHPTEIVYNNAGSFDVALTVSNAFGSDTETKTDYITVNVIPLPVANFEAGETVIYEGSPIDFTDLSSNNPTSWEWTFDGAGTASSTLQHPTGIVYNNAGSFDVALTVSNAFGSDTETKTDYITVNVIPLPVASFEAGETVIYEGGSIDFTDLSTNNPTSWEWTFDGAGTASSNLQHPTGVVYNNAGTFDVALTVTNAFGSDTETKTDYITVEELSGVIADFYGDPTTIEKNEIVQFYNLASGYIGTYEWEFEGASSSISYQPDPVVLYSQAGIFDVRLIVSGPDGSDTLIKEDYIEVTEEILNYPPGWDFTPTGMQHAIAVPIEANPRIFEIPIEAGDFMGVFYYDDFNQLRCGGAAEWTGTENIPVIAYGNDPYFPLKNGFSIGEEFQWRIYSMNDARGYPAKATYNDALALSNEFYPLGMSGLTDLFAGIKYEVQVPQGWSGISSPVDPWDKNIEDVFLDSFDKLVLLNNFDGMVWPEQSINTLFDWDNRSGYNIKVSEDIAIEFAGDAEENLVFDIQPGWTFLPVPVPCEVNTDELFTGHENELMLVREISGFGVYWPQYNLNSLENLLPGHAYMLMALEEFILEFDPCSLEGKDTFKPPINKLSLNPEWDIINASNAAHTIAVTSSASAELKTGDVIGIFAGNGQCYGQAQFDGHSFAISVFGDDVTTAITDGFDGGEQFHLILHRPAENTNFTLEVEYDHLLPNQDQFMMNGISAITGLRLIPTGFDDYNFNNIRIQPNPSKGVFNISGIEKVDKITILSPEGQKVYESTHDGTSSVQVDISNYPKGMYLIRFDNKEKPEIRKLIIR